MKLMCKRIGVSNYPYFFLIYFYLPIAYINFFSYLCTQISKTIKTMATTKEKVREKVISMLENELRRNLITKLNKLLDSGAIDFESEDDNYKLPKHIMQVLGNSMSRGYSNPHASAKDKKQIKKLDYFV